MNNPRIAARLAELSLASPDGDALEIGPGKGILTKQLLQRGVRLTAVEIDGGLCSLLRVKFAPEIREGRFKLVEGDILKQRLEELVPAGTRIAANLPYHLSTPILLKLLTDAAHFASMLLMLQKEFAQRLAAKPGTKNYGALSVFLRCRAKAWQALKIGRKNFLPAPRVDSAAVFVQPRSHPSIDGEPSEDFSNFTQMLFSQRRKKLGGALVLVANKTLAREKAEEICGAAGLDAEVRPDKLDEAELWRLFQAWEKKEV